MAKRFTQPGETVIGGLASDYLPRHSNIDTNTHVIPSMSYEHYTVHNGFHYFFTDKFVLASAAIKEYLLHTPETPAVHMHFVFDGSAITQFDIYEDSAFVGTTDNLHTTFNSNRLSSNVSGMKIYTSPTTDADEGTLIKTFKGGSAQGGSRQGETQNSAEELVLKKDAKYLVRYTSGTADNLCDIYLSWYELVAES